MAKARNLSGAPGAEMASRNLANSYSKFLLCTWHVIVIKIIAKSGRMSPNVETTAHYYSNTMQWPVI